MIERGIAAVILAMAATRIGATATRDTYDARGRTTVGSELRLLYEVLGRAQVLAPPPVDPARRGTWYVPPAKDFDDLIYVGQQGVSAWVLKTSDGLMLIDALFSYSAAEIFEGLKPVGLDPADIRHIVVSRAHLDQYVGVRALRDVVDAPLILSSADWALLATKIDGPGAKTTRDIAVNGTYTLTLGRTAVQLLVTPGYTPGTLSLLIPVHDRGVRHLVFLWGGTAFNVRSAEQYRTMGVSARMFAKRAKAADASVWMSNHPSFDDTFAKASAKAACKPSSRDVGRVGLYACGDATRLSW